MSRSRDKGGEHGHFCVAVSEEYRCLIAGNKQQQAFEATRVRSHSKTVIPNPVIAVPSATLTIAHCTRLYILLCFPRPFSY